MTMFASSLAGIQAATARFEQSAWRTASWNPMGSGPGAEVDLAKEAVEQISAKAALKANVKVVHAADDMTKTLLNILA